MGKGGDMIYVVMVGDDRVMFPVAAYHTQAQANQCKPRGRTLYNIGNEYGLVSASSWVDRIPLYASA